MKEIFAALAKAQAKLGKAAKDSTNPHFKSKYADLESCTDAIRAVIGEFGLGYIQVSHDVEKAACIETIIIHESGEQISCGKVSVPVTKADAQGFGSAMTYARRYSVSAAFGLANEDDDGNNAAIASPNRPSAQPRKPAERQTLPDDRFQNALNAVKDGNFSADKLRADYKLTESQETELAKVAQ